MIIASAFLATVSLLPQATQTTAQDVLLRYKFQAGQIIRYDTDMQMDMGMQFAGKSIPMKMEIQMIQKQSVDSVEPDGTAAIHSKVVISKSIVNGSPSPTPESSKTKLGTLEMSPRGAISKVKFPGSTGNVEGMDFSSLQINGQLPEAPVKVGSTWDSSFELPGMGTCLLHYVVSDITVSAHGTLVKLHGSGTMDMSKLLDRMAGAKGVSGGGSTDIQFDSVFDATAGSMLSTAMKANFSMDMKTKNPQSGEDMAMTMKGAEKLSMVRE